MVNAFFANSSQAYAAIPSVGDKVDNAIAAAKKDVKEIVEPKKTGIDLYSR